MGKFLVQQGVFGVNRAIRLICIKTDTQVDTHSWYRLMRSLLSDCCMMGLGFDFSCKLDQARTVIWFS